MQRATGTRLQDISVEKGFPFHIALILNPDREIKFSEILCRLIHVCMIETGFIPIIDSEPDFPVEAVSAMSKEDSVPQMIMRLQDIITKKGGLRNVMYKSIIMKQYTVPLVKSGETNVECGTQKDLQSGEKLAQQTTEDLPLDKKPDLGDATTLTSKESGDGSLVVAAVNKHNSMLQSNQAQSVTAWQEAYSENISVTIIPDGSDILVLANGPGIHRNFQVSVSEYANYQILPKAAKALEYLEMIDFKAPSFATNVKRGFCYQIMDDIDGLSFEIRSLAWMPSEIIVKIARCSSSLNVIRLRNTCSEIRGALSSTNAQFWKGMIKKDFPHHNINSLNDEGEEDKYFKKYAEVYRATFRPLRRSIGIHRPYYYNMAFY